MTPPNVTFHDRYGCNSTATDSKKVYIPDNTTITSTPQKEGRTDKKITIKTANGKATVTNNKNERQAYADLFPTAYTAMTDIIKMDRNDPKGEKLTDSDLAKLHADFKAGKKIEGVKNVRRDANAGVTTVVLNDGEIIRFDFETESEKKSRLNANG